MSKRIDRTIKNWRWWLILPMSPLFLLVITAWFCARLVEVALSTSCEEIVKLCAWVREGGDQ